MRGDEMTERKKRKGRLPFTAECILDQKMPGDITLGEARRFLPLDNNVLRRINVPFPIREDPEREVPDHMTIEEARRTGFSVHISGSYGEGGVPATEPKKV
jgi:hypothetical protein